MCVFELASEALYLPFVPLEPLIVNFFPPVAGWGVLGFLLPGNLLERRLSELWSLLSPSLEIWAKEVCWANGTWRGLTFCLGKYSWYHTKRCEVRVPLGARAVRWSVRHTSCSVRSRESKTSLMVHSWLNVARTTWPLGVFALCHLLSYTQTQPHPQRGDCQHLIPRRSLVSTTLLGVFHQGELTLSHDVSPASLMKLLSTTQISRKWNLHVVAFVTLSN